MQVTFVHGGHIMPHGDKSKYTPKQKRKARDIEKSYEARGLDAPEAEARAWATVNKQSGGGDRPGGSGRKTPASQKAAARRDSARRAVATKHGHSPNRGRLTSRRSRTAST
jgi:hypothetical protein